MKEGESQDFAEAGKVDEVQEEMEVTESGDEAIKARVAKTPRTPTRQEVKDHMPLHAECRGWCPHCVAGKGISHQHKHSSAKDVESLGITISMDY